MAPSYYFYEVKFFWERKQPDLGIIRVLLEVRLNFKAQIFFAQLNRIFG